MATAPIILSLDTSGRSLSIALSEGEAMLLEFDLHKSNMHDRLLAHYCRDFLKELSIPIYEISAVAVSSGPGSFTGLRIGSALAKGITYGNAIKLIAVPTLFSLAHSAVEYARLANCLSILSIIPSHRDLFYVQLYDLSLDSTPELELVRKTELDRFIEQRTLVAGPVDFQKIIEETRKINMNSEYIQVNCCNNISAKKIAQVAIEYYKLNKFRDSSTFEPLYAQDFIPKSTKQENQ